MTPVPLHREITKKTKKLTPIPRHNFVFWKKRRPSENGLRFGELPLHSFAVFCLPGFLLHVISGAVVDCCVLYCWYCRLTFFCLFPPLSGLKMAEGNGGCFGGAGQLPEGLLLPCTQVGGQEWRPPPPRAITLHCWLLCFVGFCCWWWLGSLELDAGPCWVLLFLLFFVLIIELTNKIMLFTLVINVLVLTKF